MTAFASLPFPSHPFPFLFLVPPSTFTTHSPTHISKFPILLFIRTHTGTSNKDAFLFFLNFYFYKPAAPLSSCILSACPDESSLPSSTYLLSHVPPSPLPTHTLIYTRRALHEPRLERHFYSNELPLLFDVSILSRGTRPTVNTTGTKFRNSRHFER